VIAALSFASPGPLLAPVDVLSGAEEFPVFLRASMIEWFAMRSIHPASRRAVVNAIAIYVSFGAKT
jgi:hypothetical protein